MASKQASHEPLFSLFEYAPTFIVYALHVPYGLYLAIKHRGFLLPAIANPSITMGGMTGESKTDSNALAGPYARSFFAPFITVYAGDASDTIEKKLRDASLSFPLIAKPDIGRNGRGVKKVANLEELRRHLDSFPRGARILIQKYISDELEAGVFYVRKPSETHGRITSLTLKYFPSLKGDGHSTLRELILKDPRASQIKDIYFRRNKRALDLVIPEGESHRLVSVGNHVRGALFENGEDYITPELTSIFDRISKDIRDFHFGRFDVRFPSLDALARGENLAILEYNGAMSEPTHVFDRRVGVLELYRVFLTHWRLAYEVGAEQRDRGVRPIPAYDVWRTWCDECALIDQYPDEE